MLKFSVEIHFYYSFFYSHLKWFLLRGWYLNLQQFLSFGMSREFFLFFGFRFDIKIGIEMIFSIRLKILVSRMSLKFLEKCHQLKIIAMGLTLRFGSKISRNSVKNCNKRLNGGVNMSDFGGFLVLPLVTCQTKAYKSRNSQLQKRQQFNFKLIHWIFFKKIHFHRPKKPSLPIFIIHNFHLNS